MVRFCCSFEGQNLLKLWTVEEAGARYSSAIVTLVGEVQHGSRDLVEECEGNNLESRLENSQTILEVKAYVKLGVYFMLVLLDKAGR
jgi:hypothetical protein